MYAFGLGFEGSGIGKLCSNHSSFFNLSVWLMGPAWYSCVRLTPGPPSYAFIFRKQMTLYSANKTQGGLRRSTQIFTQAKNILGIRISYINITVGVTI